MINALDVDNANVASLQVAHTHGENVARLLLHQLRAVALADGILVDGLRLLLLVELRHGHLVPNPHLHAIN